MARPTGFALLGEYAADRFRIMNLISNPRMAFAKSQAITNMVLSREAEGGTLFVVADGEVYFCVSSVGRIFHAPKHGRGGDEVFGYLYSRYGLPERNPLTQFVYDSLRNYAIHQGDRIELRRFACFNKENQTLYLSRYDGSMWKITGDVPEVAAIGDGAFFVDDDGGKACEPQIAPHGVLLETLTDLSFSSTVGSISADQQKMAMTVWLFALAFPDLMPTKPLLLLEGAPGSGKSSATQLIQLALLGTKKPMIIQKNREDDFGVMLLRSPIAVFDNTDEWIEWLPSAICAYTTSGLWTRRRLFTDGEEVTIRPHAFIAVASKNPASFRREDTADRCIILRLDRRTSFVEQSEREKMIEDLRPKLVGEFIYYVNKMVAAIRDGIVTEPSTHRMADFAFMARVVGHVMGWHIDDINTMILAIQNERDAFIMEDDPLFDVLTKWIVYRPSGGPSNIGREVSLLVLFKELESISQAVGIPFYKSHRVLAQKLRSPHLERDFVVQTLAIDGQRTYKIWRRTDPQLTVVEDDSPAVERGT